ncbi:MAG: hypothetical protein IJ570_03970 [Prevotella sp.]|nr:hypothetical protein [Prevotella sp.]
MLRRSLYTAMLALAALAVQAQDDDYTPPEVLHSQPEGVLRLYERSGSVLIEDESAATYSVQQQEGTIALVFAPDGATVYLQDPVSAYTLGASWVKGSLSADGTTITLPLGQYVDYTRTFDMAYQLQMLSLVDGTYQIDSLVTSVSYDITADGTIAIGGTSQQHILGLVIRTFGHPQGAAIGQDFAYLNGEWLGFGDFASVYTPSEMEVLSPPDDLDVQTGYLTSASFDGASYAPYSTTVKTGTDAQSGDFWLQGITSFLPAAWVKGRAEGSTVTLPTGQLMGTLEGIPLYLHGAALNADNSFTIKDIEMSCEADRYVTYDYLFVSTSATALEYVTFYMGATIAAQPETPLALPEDADPVEATMSYADTPGGPRSNHGVQLALPGDGDTLWLRAPWPYLPDACVRGTVADGTATFPVPQYLGTYEANDIVYPVYFTAFDATTGHVLRSLTFAFNTQNGELSAPSSPVSIGINKTGYLSVQDYFDITVVPDQQMRLAPVPVAPVASGTAPLFYDLGGRRLAGRPGSGLRLQNGRKVFIKR